MSGPNPQLRVNARQEGRPGSGAAGRPPKGLTASRNGRSYAGSVMKITDPVFLR
jgi:hypothetical protein